VFVFRGPNAEHGQEYPTLVGVDSICGYNTPGLARGVIGQRFHVADVTMIGFGRHYLTLREVDIS
jgi:hypothetical protein